MIAVSCSVPVEEFAEVASEVSRRQNPDVGSENGDFGSAITSSDTDSNRDPKFEVADCDFPMHDELGAECGWFRSYPWSDGDVQLELPVAIFRSTSEEPAPDPVFILHGGPASGVLEELDYRYEDLVRPFVAERDVVVFDQRGAGGAKPQLGCLRAGTFLSALEVPDLRRCTDRYRGRGIDPSTFGAQGIATDVVGLAAALGYAEINLVGTSYGGLVAQALMVEHPDLVRAAVLNSPLAATTDLRYSMPLSYVRALSRLADVCHQDLQCRIRHPDGLLVGVTEAFEELEENPVTLKVPAGRGGRGQVKVDGSAVASMLFSAMYQRDSIASIPALVSEVGRGDTRRLTRFVAVYGVIPVVSQGELPFSWAMCRGASLDGLTLHQDYPGARFFTTVDDGLDGRGEQSNLLCSALAIAPDSPLGPDLAEVQTPTLVLSGGFDPIVDLEQSRSLAEDLPRGRLVEFASEGHGLLSNYCASLIAQAFLDRPQISPETGCAGRDPALAFDPNLENEATLDAGDFERRSFWIGDEEWSANVPSSWTSRWWDETSTNWLRSTTGFDSTFLHVRTLDEESSFSGFVEDTLVSFGYESPEVARNKARPCCPEWSLGRVGRLDTGQSYRAVADPKMKMMLLLIAYDDEIQVVADEVLDQAMASLVRSES